MFEERGTRIEYLASVSEETADTDEYKSAVSKGVEQFFGSMKADYEKKADSVQKNIRTNIDTIRELDIKVNKVSLAYDFAAREWSTVKEKTSQALSVARGYEKGAEDSKRVEAVRELVKTLPELRSAFERYSYYKTEMVAACKEATLFGRVVHSNGRNHIMIPVGKEIGPGKDVDTNVARSFEMFPDEKLLPISHEAVPIGYDEDMEGFVERYNASAGEGENSNITLIPIRSPRKAELPLTAGHLYLSITTARGKMSTQHFPTMKNLPPATIATPLLQMRQE